MAKSVEDEPSWLHQCVAEYERPLTAYALHLLRDRERARDVVQDTFLKLCRQPREQIEARVKPWLFTVCRNRALDVMRKEKRLSLVDSEILEAEPDTAKGPDRLTQSDERGQELMRMVKQLPERQQEVVRLKFLHEMSYKEIAEVTGLTVGNVGFVLHTALKTLRRWAEPKREQL